MFSFYNYFVSQQTSRSITVPTLLGIIYGRYATFPSIAYTIKAISEFPLVLIEIKSELGFRSAGIVHKGRVEYNSS